MKIFWSISFVVSLAVLVSFGVLFFEDRYSQPVSQGLVAYEDVEHAVREGQGSVSITLQRDTMNKCVNYIERQLIANDLLVIAGTAIGFVMACMAVVGLWQDRTRITVPGVGGEEHGRIQ